MANPVVFDFRARDQAIASVRQLRGEMRKLKVTSDGLKSAFKAISVGGIATAGAIGLALKASADQEKIFRQLDSSLRTVGTSYGQSKSEIDAFLASQQRWTEFGDTETAETMARIVRLTGDYSTALEATALAQDVATARGQDLREVSNLVARAYTGNIEALGEYIPEAKEVAKELGAQATNAEKAAAGVKLLKDTYGGAAKDIGETTRSHKRFTNALSDGLEAVGDAIAKNFAFKSTIQGLLNDFTDFVTFMSQGNQELSQMGEHLTAADRDVRHFEETFRETGDVVFATTGRYAGLQQKLADLTTQLSRAKLLGFDPASQTMRTLEGNIRITQKLLEPYEQAIKRVSKEFKTAADNAAALAREQAKVGAEARKQAELDDLLNTGGFAGASLDQLKAEADAIEAVEQALASFQARQISDIEILQIVAQEFVRAEEKKLRALERRVEAQRRLEQGEAEFAAVVSAQIEALAVQSAFLVGETLGQLVFQGEFSAEAMAAAFLGAIGQMAVAVGTFLISTGIGLEALKTLSGAAAVAAGVALVAFGGILSAAAKALGGTGGGPGEAGGSGANAAFDRIPQLREDREDDRPLQVVVVIQSHGTDDSEAKATGRRWQRAVERGDVSAEVAPGALG